MKLPENVSESVKKRNPHLFGHLGCASAAQSEQVEVSSLDGGVQGAETGPRCVEVRVSFIMFRRRLVDDDSNVAAIKSLRDAVAESLGIDDDDRRAIWDYHQFKSGGEPGVIVLIEARMK